MSSGKCENGRNFNWIMVNVATALFYDMDIKVHVNVMLGKQGQECSFIPIILGSNLSTLYIIHHQF